MIDAMLGYGIDVKYENEILSACQDGELQPILIANFDKVSQLFCETGELTPHEKIGGTSVWKI